MTLRRHCGRLQPNCSPTAAPLQPHCRPHTAAGGPQLLCRCSNSRSPAAVAAQWTAGGLQSGADRLQWGAVVFGACHRDSRGRDRSRGSWRAGRSEDGRAGGRGSLRGGALRDGAQRRVALEGPVGALVLPDSTRPHLPSSSRPRSSGTLTRKTRRRTERLSDLLDWKRMGLEYAKARQRASQSRLLS